MCALATAMCCMQMVSTDVLQMVSVMGGADTNNNSCFIYLNASDGEKSEQCHPHDTRSNRKEMIRSKRRILDSPEDA